jgi:Tfp pilus assembly protein PilV
VEALIAVTILTVGILGFVGTMAAVTRTLSRGNRANRAAFYAQHRLEQTQATPCQLLTSGSETKGGVFAVSWVVGGTATSSSRTVRVIAAYPGVLSRARADTMEATVLCAR